MKKKYHLTENPTGSELAIIGMACRFPGAGNYQEFWSNLKEGRESITSLTPEQLLNSGVTRREMEHPDYVAMTPLLADMELFAADFFGYNTKEAQLMDPQQRLLLECSYHALEDAGYCRDDYKEPIGVYAGTKTNTYLFHLASNPDLKESEDFLQVVLGGDTALTSTRISYKLNLKGPSYAVQTACSTSLVAIHLACQSLLIDECRIALAGAAAVHVPHYAGYRYREGGILSPDGHCRPFDKNARGTIFGSGVGMVVLKRLTDAVEDNDHIYAVIKGTATNNDGAAKATFTAPSVDGQCDVILEALAAADVEADTISYVEAHGTGTQLGDPIELLALINAYKTYTQRTRFCALGSVKGNVGHLDAAAGISSFIKTVLALKNKQIPATLHFTAPNPRIDFVTSPFYVNSSLQDWKVQKNTPRRAGVSSFGFGGTNAHLILEESPPLFSGKSTKKVYLLNLSAKTKTALQAQTRELFQYLKKNGETELADVAFTLHNGRNTFQERRVIVCADKKEALQGLADPGLDNCLTGSPDTRNRPVNLYFACDAQATRFFLEQAWYTGELPLQNAIAECCDTYKKETGDEIKPLLFKGNDERGAPVSKNQSRVISFIITYALGRLFLGLIKNISTQGWHDGCLVAACLRDELTLGQAIKELLPPEGEQASGIPLPDSEDEVFCIIGSPAFFGKKAGGDNYVGLPAQSDTTEITERCFRTALARLWLLGAEIDWQPCYTGQQAGRIPLPGYPFEKKKYWIEQAKSENQTDTSDSRNGDIHKWFYRQEWAKQTELAPGELKPAGVWLIFMDSLKMALPLIRSLEEQGQIVITVKEAEVYRQIDNYTFELNPAGETDYYTLFTALDKTGHLPGDVVHLWSLSAPGITNEIRKAQNPQNLYRKSFTSLLYLSRAIDRHAGNTRVRLFVISNFMERVKENDPLIPAKAILLGPVLVIPQEYSNIYCKYIDTSQPAEQTALDTEALLLEMTSGVAASRIALRNKERWAPAYKMVSVDETTEKSLLQAGGVYLITGGLGNIGFVLSLYLAEKYNAKLALTCRTALPPPSEWNTWLKEHDSHEPVASKIRKVRRLQEAGADVRIYQADAANREEMDLVAGKIIQEWKGLSGIIHSAGVARGKVFKSIAEIGTPEIEAHFEPKLRGLEVLDGLVVRYRPLFCLINSSLATILGGMGNVAYTAANSFIDHFVGHKQQDSETAWLSINWDSWHQETDQIESSGIGTTLERCAILPEEGRQVFQLLTGRAEKQFIISTSSLDARINRWIVQTPIDRISAEKGNPLLHNRLSLELFLTEIWKRILGLTEINVQDNFFDLGGDSLTGLQLIEEIEKELQVRVSPVTLYGAPSLAALVEYLYKDDKKGKETAEPKAASQQPLQSRDIAIVGMSGRFPGADNVEDFFKNLCAGIESITFFSDEELSSAGIPQSLLADPNYVKARPILQNVKNFDARFFGYSPQEAAIIDPQHRIFLECAYESLENAGYDPERYSGQIGVFAGTSISSYLLNLCRQSPEGGSVDPLQAVIGNDKDSLATNVSYKLNLRGPSLTVQTFCSTSLVAVHLACQSIIHGECSMALAGGVSVFVPQQSGYHYQEGDIVSPEGKIRAFDARAKGMLFGNGAGVVVLKPKQQAIADRDQIFAVIKGSAINNDGSLKVGYSAPSIEGQALVIESALQAAGVPAESISYVEAHGTGTEMGDPIEIAALTKAFRTQTDKKEFCRIGSVKTNIGHLDRAAGVASLIKTALSLKHKKIPASLHFDSPNPKIDFESSPFRVNTSLTEWEQTEQPRRAGVSALGFGGTNAHLIMEEAPSPPVPLPGRKEQILILSARTTEALEQASRNLSDFIEAQPETDAADLAYTLQVGRKEWEHRRALVFRNTAQIPELLKSCVTNHGVYTTDVKKKGRPLFFFFAASPLPAHNRIHEIYEQEIVFKEHLDPIVEFLKTSANFDLFSIPGLGEQAPLAANPTQDPALSERLYRLAVQYALTRLLISWGIKPDGVLGSGQGIYTALCVAGVFSIEDACRLVLQNPYPPADRQKITLHAPQIRCLDPVTGNWLVDADALNQTSLFARLADHQTAEPTVLLTESHPLFLCMDTAENSNPSGPLETFDRESLVTLGSGSHALAECLAGLWCSGRTIDWNAFYNGRQRRRISLPTYPFQRKKCWIDTLPQTGNESAVSIPKAGAPEKNPDQSKWFYIPTWNRVLLPEDTKVHAEPLQWLIFLNKNGPGHSLLRELQKRNQEVTLVYQGTEFSVKEESLTTVYTINPQSKEDYLTLFQTLLQKGCFPGKIVHCWSLAYEHRELNHISDFDSYQYSALYSLLFLTQALEKTSEGNSIYIDILTNHLVAVTSLETIAPEKAGLLGFGKVVSQEYPIFTCRVIDWACTDSLRQPVERIVDELFYQSPQQVVAYRGNQRWVQDFKQILLTEPQNRDRCPDSKTYLITGGLTGIGLLISECLAACGCSLAVFETDPPGDWEKRILGLKQKGAEVMFRSVDMTELSVMQEAWNEVVAELGQIDGVFHAAGVLGERAFRAVAETGPEQCRWHFSPKVAPLLVLNRILKKHKVEFCMLASSLACYLGGRGYTAYAAANLFLDAFAFAENQNPENSTMWLSINWDAWQLPGASLSLVTGELARYAMTPTELGDVLKKILTAAQENQVIVSTGDLFSRLYKWSQKFSQAETETVSTTRHPRPELTVPYVAPKNKLERDMVRIWQESLGIEPIGIKDNFFDLGGESFAAIRMVSRLKQELQREISVVSLYEGASIEALVNLIEEESQPVPEKQEQQQVENERRKAYRQKSLLKMKGNNNE